MSESVPDQPMRTTRLPEPPHQPPAPGSEEARLNLRMARRPAPSSLTEAENYYRPVPRPSRSEMYGTFRDDSLDNLDRRRERRRLEDLHRIIPGRDAPEYGKAERLIYLASNSAIIRSCLEQWQRGLPIENALVMALSYMHENAIAVHNRCIDLMGKIPPTILVPSDQVAAIVEPGEQRRIELDVQE